MTRTKLKIFCQNTYLPVYNLAIKTKEGPRPTGSAYGHKGEFQTENNLFVEFYESSSQQHVLFWYSYGSLSFYCHASYVLTFKRKFGILYTLIITYQ